MKYVGLFFGSFNPIHLGHLAVADFFAKKTSIDEVWFVVTPHSPFKEKSKLMEDHHRLTMVELAIEGKSKFKACSEEFGLPTPNYTVDTLYHLKKKYPENQFIILLGQDNMAHFLKWKDYDQILDQFKLFIYPRSKSGKIHPRLLKHEKINYFKGSLKEFSATEIREAIKNKKSKSDLLPSKIRDYIEKFKLY